MRWLFLLLILANVFYAFWQYTAVQPAGEQPVPAPTEVAPILLLEERLEDHLGASAEAPRVPAGDGDRKASEAAGEKEEKRACWEVGPFVESAAVERAEEALGDAGYTVGREAVEVPESEVFWVHAGPFESHDAAVAARRDIQGQGIDSFVITEGELANSVSLGVFSEAQRARSVQQQHAQLPHDVDVRRLERTVEGWVLRLESLDGETPPVRVLEALPDADGHHDTFQVIKKTCD